MSIEVKVPVLPESVSDATIASWHKKAGDAVKRDENLVDLETDKVVLEVPSPVDGVLKEIRHQVGDTVNSSAGHRDHRGRCRCCRTRPSEGRAQSRRCLPPHQLLPHRKLPPRAPTIFPRPACASPTEQNIDPSKVAGTGRDGRVTKEDLVNYGKGGSAAAAPAAAPSRPRARVRKSACR
jgi:2-oxoglutarate dehydrogenase E2 component (dihydrolipoamide succinyltransferase)